MYKYHFTSLLLLLILVCGNSSYQTFDADTFSDTHEAVQFDEKQLVFFAGPHSSASKSITGFFKQWAVGHMPRHPRTLALRYWRWPKIEQDMEFSKLVIDNEDDKDETTTKIILDGIQNSFDESENGVILGTEMFDQIGPDAKYDAITAMKKVVDHLSVPPEAITVILNYRTPRVDQWYSLYKHSTNNGAMVSYDKFMCINSPDKGEYNQRYDLIGSQMNALGAAQAFLKEGWNVKLIDMGGVANHGKDISHTIGCDILLGACENGVLGSLQNRLPNTNALDKTFDELPLEEQEKIEKVFRSRDCAYKKRLDDYITKGSLEVLYKDSLWEDCNDHSPEYYEKFIDNTPMLFQVLRSQVECKDLTESNDVFQMDDLLALNGGSGEGGGGKVIAGAFEVILMLAILLGAVGYGVYMVKNQAKDMGEASGTEMASYPSAVMEPSDDVEMFQDEE